MNVVRQQQACAENIRRSRILDQIAALQVPPVEKTWQAPPQASALPAGERE